MQTQFIWNADVQGLSLEIPIKLIWGKIQEQEFLAHADTYIWITAWILELAFVCVNYLLRFKFIIEWT